MIIQGEPGSTSETLTVETAVPLFEKMLSEENSTDEESQPAKQPDSDDAEASPEQAEVEEKPEETEQADDAEVEQPEATLDPNLKVKIKIDGVDTEVTLAEALKGYSRTQDYTKKTQEAAEKRKAAEAEYATLAGERQKYAEQVSRYEQALKDMTPREPDWEKMREENPAAYPMERALWGEHKERMEALAKERADAQAAAARDQSQARQAFMESEKVRLAEAVPEWKDTAIATAEKAEMLSYARKLGYNDEQLDQIDDHRALVMLRKAMKWDAQQAKKPEAQARIETVRAATPGPASSTRPKLSKQTQALQRLEKTGRPEDLAAVFRSVLPD